jgi:hypothetical protein
MKYIAVEGRGLLWALVVLSGDATTGARKSWLLPGSASTKKGQYEIESYGNQYIKPTNVRRQ